MSLPDIDNKQRKKFSQNRWLPIILWLFPLVLLNVGIFFFNEIDRKWAEEEETDLARQEVESLASNSEFSYCFSKVAGEFCDELKEGARSFLAINRQNLFLSYLKSRAEYKFREPFPEHELYVFQISEKKTDLIFTNNTKVRNKRALSLAFEYLTKVNSHDSAYSEENRKKGKDITKNIWGGESDPEIIAETQRGKASYSFYKLAPSRFFWDYFVEEKTNNIFGFFLIVNNNTDTENAAKLIALRELRYSQQKLANKKLGAFIPLFPGSGGVVAQEEAEKIPEFKKKVREWVPRESKELYEWQQHSAIFNENTSVLDEYKAHFYVAPGQTHAAVLLVPFIKNNGIPLWIIITDIIATFAVMLLLLRGFFYNKWPQTSLKARFISTYFLAACLPMGILAIAAYGYLSEYAHTTLFKNQAKLRECINYFESCKIRLEEEYKTAFLEMQSDKKIAEAFKNLEKASKEPATCIIPEIKEVLKEVTALLNKEENKLPILSLTVLDEYGDYITNLGNDECCYLVGHNHTEYMEKGKTLTDVQKNRKRINNDTLNALIFPLLESLRKRIEIVAPDNKKWKEEYKTSYIQETVASSYKTAIGNNGHNLAEEFDMRRNMIVKRKIGNMTVSHIHNYFFVDGVPRFIVFVLWDSSSMDEKAFKTSQGHYAISEPNLFFSAFKGSDRGVKTWLDSGRHGRAFEKISYNIANQAYFRNGNASIKNDSMSVLAMPSKNFVNTVLVGGISQNALGIPAFIRVSILVLIILVSLVVLFVCIYYSSVIFLRPISNLKNTLEEVSAGNLNLDIQSHGNDEFGVMSHEFGEMIRGLNEREKLATLISDHAIEALSKSNNINSGASDVETFSGVALVTDIRNFTGLCETHEAYEITELLNEHFAQMTKIISARGGRIYKYIGDAIEVVFADRDDSANSSTVRALESAFYMLKTLKTINEERKSKGLFDYKIGIGLCYGKMTSGTIGSIDTRLDYAIISDSLKQAAKLENLTKLHPEFPLVVNNDFVKELKKYTAVAFKKMIEIDSESVGEDCFHASETSVESFINVRNEIKLNKQEIVTQNRIKNENIDNTDSIESRSINIKESFSFSRVFVPGFIFISILSFIVFGGLYFVHETRVLNEKSSLLAENESDLNQIQCDDYGKIAFDRKARYFVAELSKKIKNFSCNNITDEFIVNTLELAIKNDSSLHDIDFNYAFIKTKEYSEEILATDTAFVDKLYKNVICNNGYALNEINKIIDSFKVCEALDLLNKYSSKIKSSISKKDFCNPYLLYMKNNYGEPSRDVFGEKNPISIFRIGAKNSTVDGVMNNRPVYLFWFDFYTKNNGENKLLGYFICSMPVELAKGSLPLFLSSYSLNNSLVALKNIKTGLWHFSQNIPEKIKNDIVNTDKQGTSLNKSVIKYLNSLQAVSLSQKTNIGNESYEVYMTKFVSRDLNTHICIVLSVVILLLLFVFLFKLSKGVSHVNDSVTAKLWLALLIVAVIPVFTVILVFQLYKYEYYSVNSNQERLNMQKYADIHEAKIDFPIPLVWNYIRKKSKSEDLLSVAKTVSDLTLSETERKEALASIRSLCTAWQNLEEKYNEFEKKLINFYIADISIAGSNGWSFSLGNAFDSLDEKIVDLTEIKKGNKNTLSLDSVSYFENKNDDPEDGIGTALTLIAKSLLSKRGVGRVNKGKPDKSMVAGEVAVETGLKAIRTFMGDDMMIKMSNSINNPVIMNITTGKMGIYLSALPSFEKPMYIIVWMVGMLSNEYLNRISEYIEGRYNVYMAEAYKAGEIVREKDNELRLALGEIAVRQFATNLPFSTFLQIDSEKCFVESIPSRRLQNTMLMLSCPTKEIDKKLRQMNFWFSLLLGISLFAIGYTTKNIAADILVPLKALISGVKEIKNENFAFRIESDRTDELGILCSSFDIMARGLEEKHMMSKMISKTAQMVTLKEGAENARKTDSVFIYVSVPNFPSLIDELRDIDVFAKLKRFTSIVAGCIMESGGEVDKIMGEKLLAVYRIKKGDAKSAGIAVCKTAKKLLELEKLGFLPFPVAIGINYGNVINGFLGVGTKRDFTVIGDAVNVTARIESLSEKLEKDRCLISEGIIKLVGSDFSSVFYGEVELKGKSQPMKVYQIT